MAKRKLTDKERERQAQQTDAYRDGNNLYNAFVVRQQQLDKPWEEACPFLEDSSESWKRYYFMCGWQRARSEHEQQYCEDCNCRTDVMQKCLCDRCAETRMLRGWREKNGY